MAANELLELTPLLKTVLWIEVIVYMGIGLYEILDSFSKEKPFNYETVRQDAIEAGVEEKRIEILDKLAGHKS